MAGTDDTGGFGETYSFLDITGYGDDLLRSEFGSVWTNPWQTSDTSTATSANTGLDMEGLSAAISDLMAQPPSFGIQATPRFDIEYGPIVATKTEFSPYIAHHQSVKLIAKSDTYKNDCIDCGYHDDVRAVLGATAWSLDMGPMEAMLPGGSFIHQLLIPGENVVSDCYHSTVTPLNEEDIALAASTGNRVDQLMASGYTSFEYGDYVAQLEEVIFNLDEKDIPNLYALLYGMRPANMNSPHSPYFNQAIDYLKGNIDCDVAEVIKNISTGFENLLISAENTGKIKDMHAFKEFFSLRAETNFSTSTQASIADKLKSVNLDCRLLRWMVETKDNADLVPTGVTFEKIKENASKISTTNVLSDGPLNIRTYDLLKFCGPAGDYPGEDIQTVLEDPQPSMGFVGELDQSTLMARTSGLKTSSATNFSHIMFSNQIRMALSEHNRSFQDVVSGKNPYSETVAYRISKYKRSTFSTNDQIKIVQEIINSDIDAIQNIWLSNSSESEAIEYVDSQAKYNEGYIFVIWAYTLVLGTRYFYSNLRTSESPILKTSSEIETIGLRDETEVFLGLTSSDAIATFENLGWTIGETTMPDSPQDASSEFYHFTTSESLTIDVDDDCEAVFTATTVPMAVIKENPFFVWQGEIIDKPPVVPDIEVVPLYGNDSKLLILMNNSAGTIFTEPVLINEEEQDVFDNIKTSQGLYTGLIEFGTDNDVETYQVYRTTKLPTSYSNFSDSLLTSVSTIYEEETGKRANSTSYTDSIEPNTKYYYTFRSTDIHGHFSNPTAVYQVEIINDAGTIIPSIEIIDMEEESNKDSSKALKSLIHIVPRMTQAVVNESLSGLVGETATVVSDSSRPVLGVETETPWGKTFKIRLTSRKTKRKIDINVTFGTEYSETEDQVIVKCDTTPVEESAVEEILDKVAGTSNSSISEEEFSTFSEGMGRMETSRGTLSDGPGQARGPGRTMSPDDPTDRRGTRTTTTTIDRTTSDRSDIIAPDRGGSGY